MIDLIIKSLESFSEFVEKSRIRVRRFKVKHKWEELKEAAKRKRKCIIRYKKRNKRAGAGEYLVAPYSFRNKPGGEVLFAYDFSDGHIKSFFRDNVTGVFMTDRRFVPKWGVEIGDEDV